MTNNDTQDALDGAARAIQTIQHGVGRALPLVQALIEGRTLQPGQQDRLVGLLADSARAAGSASELLVYGLGAANPGLRVDRDTLPLELLNTSASRTLHAMLQECLVLARELDQERGWVDSDGECIGWAETIGALELGLRCEVFGARGGGRE
ncbi:hypothetical protein [Armatimonas sp.]|uniref:hypothetical protein n=1 Tax=Armatimonas sp. TaxID=1872638 RepID=UPI003750BB11